MSFCPFSCFKPTPYPWRIFAIFSQTTHIASTKQPLLHKKQELLYNILSSQITIHSPLQTKSTSTSSSPFLYFSPCHNSHYSHSGHKLGIKPYPKSSLAPDFPILLPKLNKVAVTLILFILPHRIPQHLPYSVPIMKKAPFYRFLRKLMPFLTQYSICQTNTKNLHHICFLFFRIHLHSYCKHIP